MAAKPRSKGSGEYSKPDPATDLAREVTRWFPWLAQAMLGKRVVKDVRLEGFSVRFDYLSVMVVVRGFDLVAVENVVAFGAGENIYAALRNVTTTMAKGGWKNDKYRPFK